jgi:uncharacterized protein (TIGR00369 family)
MDAPDLAARRERMVALFDRAPIKHVYGMTLAYDEQGSACFDLPYNPRFDHALNGIHGGVIGTLLDNAGWFTLAPHYDTWIATVEYSVRLHEAVAGVALRSRGWIVRLGRSVSVAGMEVRTADGRLVATGSGTFVPTSAPLD